MKIQGNQIRKLSQSETGQMSVFVALMFQVLFVFFAMVINVGLVVHDKINLQNSVDLAAFYGAQRQAELLNEIAHLNYQIRQDFKLLTFRYRVLGGLGRDGNSGDGLTMPQVGQGGNEPDTAITDVNQYTNGPEDPVVCVANQYWREFFENSSQNENYCYQQYNTSTPEIPIPPVIAGWIGANTAAASLLKLRKTCKGQAVTMLHHSIGHLQFRCFLPIECLFQFEKCRLKVFEKLSFNPNSRIEAINLLNWVPRKLCAIISRTKIEEILLRRNISTDFQLENVGSRRASWPCQRLR